MKFGVETGSNPDGGTAHKFYKVAKYIIIMRQWLINPRHMCRQHLLGEHVEIHMMYGTMKQHKNVGGYIENNLLEPSSLRWRHDELVEEMQARGYNHKSPLGDMGEIYVFYNDIWSKTINRKAAFLELMSRCGECRRRMERDVRPL